MTSTAAGNDDRHRLTAVQGLAALSLDALSSVAYGPEAILIVLVAAGAAALRYSLPVTGAIVVLAAALLVASNGNTQALVPLFAVGVFIGFTLSQLGMVRHWSEQRSRGWMSRAVINGVGALLTAATTVIELVSKFTEGAWLIVLVIPSLTAGRNGTRTSRWSR